MSAVMSKDTAADIPIMTALPCGDTVTCCVASMISLHSPQGRVHAVWQRGHQSIIFLTI